MAEFTSGAKVRCVSHSGHEPFWVKGDTPEIGEVCTLGEEILVGSIDSSKRVFKIREYPTSEGYGIAFIMRDFELIDDRAKPITH